VDYAGQLAVLNNAFRGQQSSGANIHGPNVAVKEIDGLNRLPSDFRIKIQPARSESTPLKDRVEREGYLRHIVGKLIRIPSELRVAAVHVQAAENTQCLCNGKLVLETMAGQGRMVGFDVELDFFLETVPA
jgi:hypothetical protein